MEQFESHITSLEITEYDAEEANDALYALEQLHHIFKDSTMNANVKSVMEALYAIIEQSYV